jgi:hypothetical protein
MSNITIMKNEADFARVHREYGGSSYSAALFDRGYQDMPSAWSVWALFSGKLEDIGPDEDTNNRVRIGKAIEPVIAEEVAFKMGWDLLEGAFYHADEQGWELSPSDPINASRIYVHHPDETLKIGCTVDRYIREHEDGPGIIECKNRDFMQWIENYTDDDASIRDQIQLAHQFACHPEIKWGAIAALVGGNDLKLYRYKREDLTDMIADIESRWRWLFSKVDAKEEPPLTGLELPNWLKAHEDGLGLTQDELTINDDLVGDGMTFDQLAEEYQEAGSRRKHYDKLEKQRRAQIVQHLNEHSKARSNRYRVFAKYSKVKGKSVTIADVKAAGGELEIRKEHFRLTLNFKDDAMTDQGKPTAGEKKAAKDFQAPT